ncbi:MAG: C10 family peptidase, partial [Bacteroidales bacterium]|nr:C10 family peptidase [Bacteroidales bacterium]
MRNNIQNASQEGSTHVSAAQALEVGYTFMHRSGHERGNGSVNKQAMQLIYTGAEIDSDTRAVTDCYYVFSMQPAGFVIVAADTRVKPILGYSYSNNFVVEDMPDNIHYWLDNYKNQIKAVIDNDFQSDSEIRETWSHLKSGQAMPSRSSTSVNPLLQTTWDQNCYYNQLCPEDAGGPCSHVYAGCVATAMAQVMRYWGWPTQGIGSHSYSSDYGTLSVNFSTATYNFDNMPNALNSSTSASQKEEVAKLIYHCGVAVNMGYAADGSGAYSSDVPSALYNYFAYSDNGTYRYKSGYSETGWANLIKQELNNMRPVYYAGHGTGGHAFVCDGYDENNLFHFNWGWSGSNNGYFELSTLNPSTYDFSESQTAVTGVTAGTFIRCSESELSLFARAGEQSAPKTITVCARGLSGSISVSVGNDFKVSKNGTNYYNSLTLPAAGGTLYVKYVPTQSGDVLDSLILTSGNCSARVILNGTDKVIVGTGTATSSYLPSHSYYKYSLTQQIYTPAEIGTSGIIHSIAFYNDGTEKTRNYDMYLVLTDQATFSGGTDWITISENDKVFSGEVTMAAGTWTTFQIDNFAYNGVSNLALIMDDNTGSYSSGMACRVFNAEGMALRIYSDGTNYDPANPGIYTGTVENQKNQIKIDIDPSGVICEKPKNLAFSNITPTSVTVSWSNGSGTFGYEYKKTSETEWTVACAGNCGYNCNLTGLTPNTAYQFRVHSICTENDTSGWCSGSFNTPAGIPLVEPFDNSTKPDGWTLYSGLLDNVVGGTATLVAATSGWSFGTNNGVFDSHARTNIYGSSWNKWLVTPTLLMEDNVQLSFDLALTKYSGNLQQPVDTLQQDDRFVVLITIDNGTTWKILRQWDNVGSEYVYNHITCSAEGEPVTIDLSNYAGSNIAVAFYGESTVSGNGDNNLHIDNVSIDYIPTCLKPTALTATDVTAHTASLSWESDAVEWQICLNGDETNLINVTTDSYTLTDLTPETVYTVKVRAYCSTELQSPWSDEISFMPTAYVVIGSGNGTNNYLPTNAGYQFSLTQQIYTVEELGEAGRIRSIAFTKSNAAGCSRNLDIYMVSTTKSAFTGSTDWIPVTTSDKVFSGTVNFADNDWTTITLSTPFAYDGEQNVAIVVDDNSGSAGSSAAFRVFPAENQALRVCSRKTNYIATSTSYTGTMESSKNQIRVFIDREPDC